MTKTVGKSKLSLTTRAMSDAMLRVKDGVEKFVDKWGNISGFDSSVSCRKGRNALMLYIRPEITRMVDMSKSLTDAEKQEDEIRELKVNAESTRKMLSSHFEDSASPAEESCMRQLGMLGVNCTPALEADDRGCLTTPKIKFRSCQDELVDVLDGLEQHADVARKVLKGGTVDDDWLNAWSGPAAVLTGHAIQNLAKLSSSKRGLTIGTVGRTLMESGFDDILNVVEDNMSVHGEPTIHGRRIGGMVSGLRGLLHGVYELCFHKELNEGQPPVIKKRKKKDKEKVLCSSSNVMSG